MSNINKTIEVRIFDDCVCLAYEGDKETKENYYKRYPIVPLKFNERAENPVEATPASIVHELAFVIDLGYKIRFRYM